MHRLLRIGCALVGFGCALSWTFAQPPMPPAPVIVAAVVQQEVASGVTLVGTVRPVRTSIIGAAVDGRVEEFPVTEGQRVSKGQLLAKLRTGTLEIERAAAQAELKLREEEQREMRNGMRPEEKKFAKAKYDFCKSRYDRVKGLHGRGAVGDEELQDAFAAYEQADANWEMARVGQREEKIKQAEARVAMQVEAVRKLDDQIGLHSVKAPFDGYITTDHCEIGQWLIRGAAVTEVVYLDEVDVEVQLAEDNVAGVRIGAEARVEVSALPGEVFVGKVAVIVPQANARSRTFPVKIRVTNRLVNEQPLLKSNLFARVTLPLGKPEKALLVPKDAIVLGGTTPIVYVVDADNKVRPVSVQLGVCSGGLISVRAELKAGEQVVIQGNERLMPGATVAPTSNTTKK